MSTERLFCLLLHASRKDDSICSVCLMIIISGHDEKNIKDLKANIQHKFTQKILDGYDFFFFLGIKVAQSNKRIFASEEVCANL